MAHVHHMMHVLCLTYDAQDWQRVNWTKFVLKIDRYWRNGVWSVRQTSVDWKCKIFNKLKCTKMIFERNNIDTYHLLLCVMFTLMPSNLMKSEITSPYRFVVCVISELWYILWKYNGVHLLCLFLHLEYTDFLRLNFFPVNVQKCSLRCIGSLSLFFIKSKLQV